ncbi:hypothetical protein ABPG74_005215 [Tetrahymena malaccensis]
MSLFQKQILFVLLQYLSLSTTQQDNCNKQIGYYFNKQQCNQCSKSCYDCYFDENFYQEKCVQCSNDFFFDTLSNSCIQGCPPASYSNQDQICLPCSDNCLKCTENECLECQNGYSISTTFKKQCISNICSNQMFQNNLNMCDYVCINTNQIPNFQLNECISQFECTQNFKQTESINSDVITAFFLFQSSKNILTVDQFAQINIFRMEDLQLLFNIQNQSLQKVEKLNKILIIKIILKLLDCQFRNDQDIYNDIITCMFFPYQIVQIDGKSGQFSIVKQLNIQLSLYVQYVQIKQVFLLKASDINSIQLFNYIDLSLSTYSISINLPTAIYSIDNLKFLAQYNSLGVIQYFDLQNLSTQQLFKDLQNQVITISIIPSSQNYLLILANQIILFQLEANTLQLNIQQTLNIQQQLLNLVLLDKQNQMYGVIGVNSLQIIQVIDNQLSLKNELVTNQTSFLQTHQFINVGVNFIYSCNNSNNQVTIYSVNSNSLFSQSFNYNFTNAAICQESKFFGVYNYSNNLVLGTSFRTSLFLTFIDQNSQQKNINSKTLDYPKALNKKLSSVQNLAFQLYDFSDVLQNVRSDGIIQFYSFKSKKLQNSVRLWQEAPYNYVVPFNIIYSQDIQAYVAVGIEYGLLTLKFLYQPLFPIYQYQQFTNITILETDLVSFNQPIYNQNPQQYIIVSYTLTDKFTNFYIRTKYFFLIPEIEQPGGGWWYSFFACIGYDQNQNPLFSYSQYYQYFIVSGLNGVQSITLSIYRYSTGELVNSMQINGPISSFGTFLDPAGQNLYYVDFMQGIMKLSLNDFSTNCIQSFQWGNSYFFLPDFSIMLYGTSGGQAFVLQFDSLLTIQVINIQQISKYIFFNPYVGMISNDSNISIYLLGQNVLIQIASQYGNVQNMIFYDNYHVLLVCEVSISVYLLYGPKSILSQSIDLYETSFINPIIQNSNQFFFAQTQENLLIQVKMHKYMIALQYENLEYDKPYIYQNKIIVEKRLHLINYNNLLITENILVQKFQPNISIKSYIQNSNDYQVILYYTNIAVYFPKNNYLIVMFAYTVAVFEADTMKNILNQSFNVRFFRPAIDLDIGYITFIESRMDYVLDLNNLTLEKYLPDGEIISYFIDDYNLDNRDYFVGSFINPQIQQAIFFEQNRLRVLSLKTRKYILNYVSLDFVPLFGFYNPNTNSLIFENSSMNFEYITLNPFTRNVINIPKVNHNPQERANIFYFFQNSNQALQFNSKSTWLNLISLSSLSIISSIQLNYPVYNHSNQIIDEDLEYIILLDSNNWIELISYSSNQIIAKFQLTEDQDMSGYMKHLLWDHDKNKIIAVSINAIYIFNVQTNLVELTHLQKFFIYDFSLCFKNNILGISDKQLQTYFDYNALIEKPSKVFPKYLTPTYLQIDQTQIIIASKSDCSLKYLKNGLILFTYFLNSYSECSVNLGFMNETSCIFYAALDNQVQVLKLLEEQIIFIQILSLNGDVARTIDYNNDSVIFISSSSIDSFSKQPNAQNEYEIFQLTPDWYGMELIVQGNNQTIIYTYPNIDYKIAIWNPSTGVYNEILYNNNIITQLQKLNETTIVVLLDQIIVLIDFIKNQETKRAILAIDNSKQNKGLTIDFKLNRIIVFGQQFGSQIFDFDLNDINMNIYVPGMMTKFDNQYFYIYSSTSCNLYSRSELKRLQIYRQFGSDLILLSLTYSGIDDIFISELDGRISIVRINPQLTPYEIDGFEANNYSLIYFIIKNIGINSNQKIYQIFIQYLTPEGLFSYQSQISLQNNSKVCSLSIPTQIIPNYSQDTIQSQIDQFQLTQTSSLQSINLNLNSTISEFIIPNFNSSIIDANFGANIIGTSKFQHIVYLNSLLANIVNYYYITINQMNLSLSKLTNPLQFQSNSTNSIQLSKIVFSNLSFSDLSNQQLKFRDLDSVVFTDINFQGIQFQNSETEGPCLQLDFIDIVVFDGINFNNTNIVLSSPFIQLSNVNQIILKNISLLNVNLTANNFFPFLLLENSTNIMLNNLIIYNSQIISSAIIQVQNASDVSFNQLFIKNTSLSTYQNNSFNNNLMIQQPLLMLIQSVNSFQLSVISIQQVYFKSLGYEGQSMISISQINQNFIVSNLTLSNSSCSFYNESGFNQFYFLKGYGLKQAGFYDLNFNQTVKISAVSLDILSNSQFDDIKNKNIIISSIKAYGVSLINNFISIVTGIIMFDSSSFNDIDGSQNFQFSLINITQAYSVQLNNITAFNLSMIQQGFLNIQNSQNATINYSKFQGIKQSQQGPAIFLQGVKNLVVNQNMFKNNQAIQNGGNIYLNDVSNSLIIQNIFADSLSLNGNGGGIQCISSVINQLKQNNFINNTSIKGSGGAIDMNSCDLIDFQKNTFSHNSAIIGGAIRYRGLKPFFLLDKNPVLNIMQLNTFQDNSATLYGNNITSYPQQLIFKNKKKQDKEKDLLYLDNFQSGSYLQQTIDLVFLDEFGNEISLTTSKKVSLDILQEISLYNLQVQSDQIYLYGDAIQQYNQNTQAISFNISLTYYPQQSSSLSIFSPIPLPYFQSGIQQLTYQIFQASVKVNFRACQIGEIIQKSQNKQICYSCPEGFYSLFDPDDEDNKTCKKCPYGTLYCKKNIINLQNGYWRESNFSDVIIECNYKQFCIAQEPNSILGCYEGHIGPLCQECDYNGLQWSKRYGKNSDQTCQECENIAKFKNIGLFFMLFGFLIVYAFLQVFKQIQVCQKQIIAKYLVLMGFNKIDQSQNLTRLTSYMKILLNYLQLIVIVNSIELESTTNKIENFNFLAGDTTGIGRSILDCFFSKIFKSIPIYVSRLIVQHFIVILIFIGIQLLGYNVLVKRDMKYNKQFFYSSIIVLFMLFQPMIIKLLSSSLSCMQIGDKFYVSADFLSMCYDSQHISYIFKVCFPIVLFWLIIVPFFLLHRMHHYKSKFNYLIAIYRYGYLYQVNYFFQQFNLNQFNFFQEYRTQVYFWDIIRMYFRSIIIISINIVRVNPILQALLLESIAFAYLLIQRYFQPYKQKQLNEIERNSFLIALISVQFLLIQHQIEIDSFSQFTYIVIYSINIFYILKLLKYILIQPINYNFSKKTWLSSILKSLKNRFPIIFNYIKIQQETDHLRLNKNLQKLRNLAFFIKKSNTNYLDVQKQEYAKTKQKMLQKQKKLKEIQIQNQGKQKLNCIFTSKLSRSPTQKENGQLYNYTIQSPISRQSPKDLLKLEMINSNMNRSNFQLDSVNAFSTARTGRANSIFLKKI